MNLFVFYVLCIFSSIEQISSSSTQKDEEFNIDYCLDCSIVDCVPELQPWDCPDGYYYLKNIYFGCCPACVKYLEHGESCDWKSWSKQKLLSETTELECSKSEKRVLKKEFIESKYSKEVLVVAFDIIECSPDSECKEGKCKQINETSCLKQMNNYEEWLAKNSCSTYEWKPHCNQYGYFDNIQSKSNSFQKTKIYCSDVKGNPISGAYNHMNQDERSSTSCLCSRKKDEIIKIGEIKDSSLHCSIDGSYEKLQCDQKLCWCMNPSNPTSSISTVVPELFMKALPCYKSFDVGTMYLRRCESRSINKIKTGSILKKHGHFWRQPYETNCEYDGSFGPIQCTVKFDKICKCIDPYGKQIKQYFASINSGPMDCRCARDEYHGYTNQECANHFGGYKELQHGLGEEWCIDKNGYQWSMSVMQNPAPGKRCKIPNCEESESNCGDNCVDCSKCGQCGRNPGEPCYP